MDKAPLLRPALIDALFALPDIEGRFSDVQNQFLHAQGQRRPLVLIASAPRSAGTFLRAAAIEAVDGQLMRFVQAEGGRDATLYLPTLLAYFEGLYATDIAVTHVHMPASDANRHMMDALDLRPIIMLRSIPDMLSSLWTLLGEGAPLGFSFLKPSDFAHKSETDMADLMIDVMGPWYVQYFAGWKRYAEDVAGRVCVLDFADFSGDPAGALEQALAHARVPKSYAACQNAIAAIWNRRQAFRCNPGRPPHPFGPERLARLAHLLSLYPELAAWREQLLPHSAV